ncbi:MAG: transposase [Gammaproteobacteria bacterium]|nr:transposase [Gammaproteobacteria bacterium]
MKQANQVREVTPASQYHRTHLPHFEAGEVPQHISFRLADSLPEMILARWRSELVSLPEAKRTAEMRERVEAALDRGYGTCWLRRPQVAALVQEALLHFEHTRYVLHAWVIMPNHVHALMTALGGRHLSAILHSWKSFTAKSANRHLGRKGEFWQADYFDRVMRDEAHFAATVDYIHWNPVKAGLCAKPEDWPWSSFSRTRG